MMVSKIATLLFLPSVRRRFVEKSRAKKRYVFGKFFVLNGCAIENG